MVKWEYKIINLREEKSFVLKTDLPTLGLEGFKLVTIWLNTLVLIRPLQELKTDGK